MVVRSEFSLYFSLLPGWEKGFARDWLLRQPVLGFISVPLIVAETSTLRA